MRKRKLLLITLFCFILSLTGCGNSLKDDTIVNDIKAEMEKSLNENETIDSVEITSRDTNKETEETTVFVTVTSNDGTVEYVRYYVAWYSVNDDKEWYLLEIDKNKVEDWTVTPISGVAEEDILSSLRGEVVQCGEDRWEISSNNVKEFKVVSQNTNLKGLTDEVKVELTLDGKLQKVKGEVTVKYEFDERWKMEEVIQDDDFVAETKEEYELKIAEGDLKKLLTRDGSVIIKSSANVQDVKVSESEVSNFKINDIVVSDKGERRIYKCTCTVTKQLATLNLDLEFTYLYDDSEWYLWEPGVDCKAEVVALNIVGTWTGRYTGAGTRGTSTLTISSVSEDGTITGVYSYVPDKIDKYTKSGSYKVSGKIDMTTLAMTLVAGDWVEEDSTAFVKRDINANLYISDMKIEGLGQSSCSFEITKQ